MDSGILEVYEPASNVSEILRPIVAPLVRALEFCSDEGPKTQQRVQKNSKAVFHLSWQENSKVVFLCHGSSSYSGWIFSGNLMLNYF